MKEIKKEFVEKCSQDIRDVLKDLVKFDDIEGVLKDVEGINNVTKNGSTISPLDINYEFEYKNEQYRLRAVAINLDYSTGNYHTFPGVLQLMKVTDLPMYLDNIKKQKIKKINTKFGDSDYEYEEYDINGVAKKYQPKNNNMPLIKGNGAKAEELKECISYWLHSRGALFNRGALSLDKLAGDKSDEVYEIAKNFLDEKQIDYYFNDSKNPKGATGKGAYNSSNFKWFLDKDKSKVILSPLTYNNGGIY